MKIYALSLLAAAAMAPSAAMALTTVVDFDGAIATIQGPGSMSAYGAVGQTFNTVSGFGLPPMVQGGDKGVMSFNAAAAGNASGLLFTHASPSPNTTGYTIVMDVYFAVIPNYLSLLQLNTSDANGGGDGDLFGRSNGDLGVDGDFEQNWRIRAGFWNRVVFTVEPGRLAVYVDGAFVNLNITPSSAGRYDLSEPSFLLFGDDDGQSAAGYISQFGFMEGVLGRAEIASLGEVKAYPLPEPGAAGLAAAGALGLVSRRRRA